MAEDEAVGKHNPFRENKLMRVRDMRDIPEETRATATEKVAELTVRDLDDLAVKLAGVPTFNPTIDELNIEDLRSLEELFQSYRQAKLERLQGIETVGSMEAIEDWCEYSCCCCTPCCCCAAADVNPIEA